PFASGCPPTRGLPGASRSRPQAPGRCLRPDARTAAPRRLRVLIPKMDRARSDQRGPRAFARGLGSTPPLNSVAREARRPASQLRMLSSTVLMSPLAAYTLPWNRTVRKTTVTLAVRTARQSVLRWDALAVGLCLMPDRDMARTRLRRWRAPSFELGLSQVWHRDLPGPDISRVRLPRFGGEVVRLGRISRRSCA